MALGAQCSQIIAQMMRTKMLQSQEEIKAGQRQRLREKAKRQGMKVGYGQEIE